MKKLVFIFLMALLLSFSGNAEIPSGEGGKCVGRFLNPITDICWSCMFPITIGKIPIIRSSKFKDTANPSMPVCFCTRAGIPMVPGLSVGFWEPIRIIEITKTPYCLVSLGGIKIMSGRSHGDNKKIRSESEKRSKAFYHIHYYVYPPLFLLNLLSDFGCMDMSSYDLAYLSELDPSHTSDTLSNFMHPETFLLSNPIAKMACSVDCITSTATKKSMDALFWCAGCQGSIYPFTGNTDSHVGGVATSQLLATRQIAKLHRLGLARKTATSSSKPNGELCKSSYAWRIPKSQYRTQMTYPRPNVKGGYSCNNIGMSDVMYSSGREFPYKGEDFAYMLFRKKNCCLL
jgi:conjugal transfer pilus assembly protein TraU